MVWITVSKTMPSPKKTERTEPIAASSASRVRLLSHETKSNPAAAESAAPNSSPIKLRPSPPNATITMKASATPGSVAWEMASLTNARLRKNRKVPPTPAAMPKSVAPSVTSVAL